MKNITTLSTLNVNRAIFFMMWALVGFNAFSADATKFSPLPVTVTAKPVGGGIPVGTVVAWPVSKLPTGQEADKWLECMGQPITEADFPELFAIVGAAIPNYQGVFLRGLGSQVFDSGGYGSVLHSSGAIGQTQGDAARKLSGRIGATEQEGEAGTWTADGSFYQSNYLHSMDVKGGARFFVTEMDTSRQVPTAGENRPVNKAVKYLIRAKP